MAQHPSPSSLPTAGIARRLASLFYELLLMAALLLTISAVMTLIQSFLGKSTWLDLLLKFAIAICLFGYFGYCWVKDGQTVAMKAWKIRLVTVSGGPIGWHQAGIRYLLALLLFTLLPAVGYMGWVRVNGPGTHALWMAMVWYAIPFIAAFYDKDRTFLHDRLAGTRQIRVSKKASPASSDSQTQ